MKPVPKVRRRARETKRPSSAPKRVRQMNYFQNFYAASFDSYSWKVRINLFVQVSRRFRKTVLKAANIKALINSSAVRSILATHSFWNYSPRIWITSIFLPPGLFADLCSIPINHIDALCKVICDCHNFKVVFAIWVVWHILLCP